MDRIAVSGTVDAGSIPAWSAKVTTLCDMYEQVLGGLCPPAELISQRVDYFVWLSATTGKNRHTYEIRIFEEFIRAF